MQAVMISKRLSFRRAATLVALLATIGCGGGSESPGVVPAPAPAPAPDPAPPPAPEPDLTLPDDPAAVILEVWLHIDGLPPEYRFYAPFFWLTAGGALYTMGPTPEIWPPPLLPPLRETMLTAEEFDQALAGIVAASLPEAEEEHIPSPGGGMPGLPTTEILFRDIEGEHAIRVEGLTGGLGTHPDARVEFLVALLQGLEAASEDSTPYAGDRLQVVVVFDPLPVEPMDRDERPWPLPDPPSREGGQRFSCHVVEGAVVAGLLEVFGTARETTRWIAGEETIGLFARPLFPGEAGCRPLE